MAAMREAAAGLLLEGLAQAEGLPPPDEALPLVKSVSTQHPARGQ